MARGDGYEIVLDDGIEEADGHCLGLIPIRLSILKPPSRLMDL